MIALLYPQIRRSTELYGLQRAIAICKATRNSAALSKIVHYFNDDTMITWLGRPRIDSVIQTFASDSALPHPLSPTIIVECCHTFDISRKLAIACSTAIVVWTLVNSKSRRNLARARAQKKM